MQDEIPARASETAAALAPLLCPPDPRGLAVHLLRLLARGRPVAPAELAAAAGEPLERVRAWLRTLPDAELDEQGRIVGHGLTLRPTPHRFMLAGRELYTWCAVDTLAYPLALGEEAAIESRCAATGAPIRLRAGPDGIEGLEPAGAVVSLVVPESCCGIRGAFCDHVHFFASAAAAHTWLGSHPGGRVLPVAEAFELARRLTSRSCAPAG